MNTGPLGDPARITMAVEDSTRRLLAELERVAEFLYRESIADGYRAVRDAISYLQHSESRQGSEGA